MLINEQIDISYGEDLRALVSLLSKSPSMIPWGEDRVPRPTQSGCCNKEQVGQIHPMTLGP